MAHDPRLEDDTLAIWVLMAVALPLLGVVTVIDWLLRLLRVRR